MNKSTENKEKCSYIIDKVDINSIFTTGDQTDNK